MTAQGYKPYFRSHNLKRLLSGICLLAIAVALVMGGVLHYRGAFRTPAPRSQDERTRLSQVIVSGDQAPKIEPESSLVKLTRYKNSAGVYSVTDQNAAVDFEIGFARPSTSKAPGNPIFLCSGMTTTHEPFEFYSTFANCWGASPQVSSAARPAGFRLDKTLSGPLYLPVFVCMTPARNRYLTLNYSCEAKPDKMQELLGYARAFKIFIK